MGIPSGVLTSSCHSRPLVFWFPPLQSWCCTRRVLPTPQSRPDGGAPRHTSWEAANADTRPCGPAQSCRWGGVQTGAGRGGSRRPVSGWGGARRAGAGGGAGRRGRAGRVGRNRAAEPETAGRALAACGPEDSRRREPGGAAAARRGASPEAGRGGGAGSQLPPRRRARQTTPARGRARTARALSEQCSAALGRAAGGSATGGEAGGARPRGEPADAVSRLGLFLSGRRGRRGSFRGAPGSRAGDPPPAAAGVTGGSRGRMERGPRALGGARGGGAEPGAHGSRRGVVDSFDLCLQENGETFLGVPGGERTLLLVPLLGLGPDRRALGLLVWRPPFHPAVWSREWGARGRPDQEPGGDGLGPQGRSCP